VRAAAARGPRVLAPLVCQSAQGWNPYLIVRTSGPARFHLPLGSDELNLLVSANLAHLPSRGEPSPAVHLSLVVAPPGWQPRIGWKPLPHDFFDLGNRHSDALDLRGLAREERGQTYVLQRAPFGLLHQLERKYGPTGSIGGTPICPERVSLGSVRDLKRDQAEELVTTEPVSALEKS
jgi:hypothetical protein